MQNRKITAVALILVALVVGAMFLPQITATENKVLTEVTKTITASGTAAVTAKPDVAYISIGVETEGKELSKVQAEASTKMDTVIKQLKAQGIVEKDIKTTNFSVNPKYEWDNITGKSTQIGYTVNNTVEVTINDITKVGKVIDQVVASGSNRVNSLRFGLKDETTLYNQALELAVKDAKAKAISMGKGLGINNIEPLHISEIGSRYSPIYAAPEMAKNAMDMVAIETPISQGELEITAQVSVEFEFK